MAKRGMEDASAGCVSAEMTKTEKPPYHGHRGRLRERFLKAGAKNLPDYEILDGASEGERVIVCPSDQVRSGVRLVQRP